MMNSKVSLFVVMVFSLFGPKLGLIDTGFLVSFCYLLLTILLNNNYKIREQFLFINLAMVILLIYSLVVFLANQNSETDLNIVLRAIRSLMAAICLGLIFYNTKVGLSAFVSTLLFVLLLHPLTMIFQLIYPGSMSFFSEYWTFGKTPPLFRAFGLTAGLGTAGYFCILGQILAGVLSLRTKNYFGYHCFYMVFLIAGVFTARNAIFLSILIYLVYMFQSIQLKRKSVGLYVVGQSIFMATFLSVIVLPLIMYSFFDGSNTLSMMGGFEMNISETYSKGTVNDLLSNHYILPTEAIDLIFGNAMPAPMDPGYTRLISTIGIVGLLISVLTYVLMLIMSVSSYKLAKNLDVMKGNDKNYRLLCSLIQVLIVYLILTFVFNIKHSYFFTRGFFEIIIILYFYTLKFIHPRNKTWKF